MKAVMGIVAALVAVAAGVVGYMLYQSAQDAKKWDSAKEILSEEIEEKDGVWIIKMESLIDESIEDVWAATYQVERMAEFIPENFKKSELRKSEGNTKVVDLEVQVLTLPKQKLRSTFVFDEPNHHVSLDATGPAQEMKATYQLLASPDGTKTIIKYNAETRMKIAVPLPAATQKGAFKELFVKTIRAIKKGVESERNKGAKAA